MIEFALVGAIGFAAVAFSFYLARWISSRPIGEGEMPKIAALVRRTTERFLRRQSSTIGALSAALGGAIFLAYGLLRRQTDGEPVSALELGVWLTVSFATGVVSTIATAHAATWIATRSGVRAAAGARRSLDLALQIAMRGGAALGVFVVALGLLGMGGLFALVFAYKGGFSAEPTDAYRMVAEMPLMISGYALGASFSALLAQLGGATFATSADLGADIAGKEAGLDEDDPTNPAAIADLAGDCVGDCAGRAAGMFESTVAENLAAMLVGAALYRHNAGLPSALSVMLFPLVARAFGVVGAIFGVMVVRTDDREEPLDALARGLYVSAALHAAGLAGSAKWLLGPDWLQFFGCGCIGIGIAVVMFHSTRYYTEHRHRPVRELAEVSRGGPALTVLGGIAIGIESAIVPCAIFFFSIGGSYYLGASTLLIGGGLFGVAIAMIGMVGTSGYVLAMDAFGPIVDNAGGIVEMAVAHDRPDVRGRTVLLDSVGNTTKAATRATTASSAAICSVLLALAYIDEVNRRLSEPGKSLGSSSASLQALCVLSGAILGIGLMLWLLGRTVADVMRGARRLIDEVRRQLPRQHVAESPRAAAATANGTNKPATVPDYDACAEMMSHFALRRMILPAVVVVGAPAACATLLRVLFSQAPFFHAQAVGALVVSGVATGSIASLFLGNAGALWDNAKQYVVTGAHGGRHLEPELGVRTVNPVHIAVLVGDAVGDPLKNAAAPAMQVVARMWPAIALVFLPFFL